MLTNRKIFRFWFPLALTWLFMSVEGPLISAFIARLPSEKINLAAYGVAFSIALIIESPIIMLLSASTALVTNRDSFKKLFRFSLMLNIGITGIMLILVLPPVFNWLIIGMMNIPRETARLIHSAIAILLPWPSAIGFRRFYQGLLIRVGQTGYVTLGTVIRLFAMGATATTLFLFAHLPGALVGAWALSAGVVIEAVVSRFLARHAIRQVKNSPAENIEVMSYREIANFYFPLAATSILTLGAHPVVVFFLGHSREALNSLAILPVLNSFIFIFRSVGLSFQEAAIALMDSTHQVYKKLRNFTLRIAIAVSIFLLVIIFTPLFRFWFGTVIGLKPDLLRFAFQPSLILSVIPALAAFISFQRAVLVVFKNTTPITLATVLEFGGIIFVLLLTTWWGNWIGIMGAALAFVVGRLLANSYLQFNILHYLRK